MNITLKLSSLVLSLLSAGLLAACGDKPAPPPAASASTPATSQISSSPAAATENTLGKTTFAKTCAMCHAAGVAGAPKPGDKADWQPRIAQGMEVLYQHAIEGFTGAKGMMPARGGAASLGDDDVKAAVNFMVEQSR